MSLRSTRLGEDKIGSLLLSLSLPATIAMIVNGLYNLVDTIFIGQGVGDLAIGGLAIAFPVQMLIMGFAQMVGIGAASAISRNLGAGNVERADKVAGNAYTSIFILSLLFAIFGLSFTRELMYVFGATEELLPYASDYIRIIFWGSVFFSFAMMSNSIIRAEGNARAAMTTMLLGAITNILLDPIFIFDKINIPYTNLYIPGFDLGIKGAALATIIGQFLSFLYVLWYLYSGKSSLKLGMHHLKLDFSIVREIFSIGFSAFARSSTGSIFAIVVNNSLRIYGGNMAITIFGIINRVLMFLLMPLIGVVQGMQPIAGYNYGAKQIDRVKEVLKLSIFVSSGIAVFGWIVGQVFPHYIIRAFTDNVNIVKDGAFVFRIIIAMIPFVGIQFVGATLFQAIGKATPSLILSMLRQFIVLTPLILILPRLFNLNLLGIWLAFPLADIIALIVTLILLKSEMNKINIEANLE